MKRLAIILSFLLLIGISCNKQPDLEKALQTFAIEAEADISDYEVILFIPLEGCGSCIEHSTEFYQNNCDNTNILFVFCTYKPYAYDFLKNNNRGNVVIDKNDVAIQNKILSTAPIVYKRNNNKYKHLGVITADFDFNQLFINQFR